MDLACMQVLKSLKLQNDYNLTQMEKPKPLKRHKSIVPLSKDHHQALLLCWKIRTGFKKNIDVQRIKSYSDWFWENHIQPHFKIEEKHVFPVLGNNHDLIKKALTEHRRLKRLFESEIDVNKTLSLIEEELENHVRFEERILFGEIQKVASETELKNIAIHHQENFCDNREDEFWK